MNIQKPAMALAAVAMLSALALSGCSSSTQTTQSAVSQEEIDKAMTTPTTLTFWTWLPKIKDNVAMFEKKYPAIKVNIENVGNGMAEFTKIITAMKAGSGAPDVAQLSTSFLSSFVATDSLMDLAPYGANDIASDFMNSAWKQVTDGSHVWGIPQDWGPVGNAYRTDIFAKAGITSPPTTWDEYAADAEKIKSATGSYMTNFAPDPEIQVIPALIQGGAKPFSYDGKKTVTINVNSDSAKKTMSYWQTLIQKELVSVDPDFTDQWYQGLSNGSYASWLAPAWGPIFLEGTAKKTSGLWKVATVPQKVAGETKYSDAGGSSNVVLKTTKNPIAAAMLAQWINSDPESTLMFATKESLFPTTTATLNDPVFINQKSDFFSGQQVNKLYSQISESVTPGSFLPFMGYVDSSFNDTLGKAIAQKGDLSAGLDAWQDALVTYAKKQGFTVTE